MLSVYRGNSIRSYCEISGDLDSGLENTGKETIVRVPGVAYRETAGYRPSSCGEGVGLSSLPTTNNTKLLCQQFQDKKVFGSYVSLV